MKIMKREQYLEIIPHVTKNSPYSMHKSYFDNLCPTALYLHLHPEMEFLYLEEGALAFRIEEKIYEMQAGDAIFIPQNMLHTAEPRSEHGMFRAICFSPEYLTLNMEQRHVQKYINSFVGSGVDYTLLIQGEEWEEVLGCLKKMFHQAEKIEEPDLLIRGYLLIILQYVYKQYIVNILGKNEKSRKEELLEPAIEYIHTHFSEDLTLHCLAEQVHMSEGQFCRIFKQVMGNTPFTYLKKYRITKSCIYLSETDKKISEICSLCGFNNISYYNREFLRIMKITPSKYRTEAEKYKSLAWSERKEDVCEN